jgi:hypothetical protein
MGTGVHERSTPARDASKDIRTVSDLFLTSAAVEQQYALAVKT